MVRNGFDSPRIANQTRRTAVQMHGGSSPPRRIDALVLDISRAMQCIGAPPRQDPSTMRRTAVEIALHRGTALPISLAEGRGAAPTCGIGPTLARTVDHIARISPPTTSTVGLIIDILPRCALVERRFASSHGDLPAAILCLVASDARTRERSAVLLR